MAHMRRRGPVTTSDIVANRITYHQPIMCHELADGVAEFLTNNVFDIVCSQVIHYWLEIPLHCRSVGDALSVDDALSVGCYIIGCNRAIFMVLLNSEQENYANLKALFQARDLLTHALTWRFLLLRHYLRQILPLEVACS